MNGISTDQVGKNSDVSHKSDPEQTHNNTADEGPQHPVECPPSGKRNGATPPPSNITRSHKTAQRTRRFKRYELGNPN